MYFYQFTSPLICESNVSFAMRKVHHLFSLLPLQKRKNPNQLKSVRGDTQVISALLTVWRHANVRSSLSYFTLSLFPHEFPVCSCIVLMPPGRNQLSGLAAKCHPETVVGSIPIWVKPKPVKMVPTAPCWAHSVQGGYWGEFSSPNDSQMWHRRCPSLLLPTALHWSNAPHSPFAPGFLPWCNQDFDRYPRPSQRGSLGQQLPKKHLSPVVFRTLLFVSFCAMHAHNAVHYVLFHCTHSWWSVSSNVH